jgi:L-asparaginase II
MKIKIIRGTVVEGKDVFQGQIVEVSDNVGKMLIQLGKAEEIKEEEVKQEDKHRKKNLTV